MFHRACLSALLVAGVALAVSGCTNNTSVSSITVSPATQSVTVGETANFTATGTINHGSHPATTEDVTSMVTWTTSAPAVATVNSSGVATAVSVGSATITATLSGGVASNAAITVTPSVGGSTGGDVTSITVVPGTQSDAQGDQTHFIGIGTTSSGATENVTTSPLIVWSSSDTNVVTIGSSSGIATAVNQGAATISAILTNADKTVASGTSNFTVQGPPVGDITSLSITPTTQSLSASGQTSQLIALGTSGTTGLEADVTGAPGIKWVSSISTIASVTPTGLVKGVSPGQVTVTAIYTNTDGSAVSASATVTTTSTLAPEPLLSLTIIPSVITVDNLQDTGNFLAIGTFSDYPYVRDLTESVTWTSSFPSSFPVDTSSTSGGTGSPAGIVTAYGSGSATIIAEYSYNDPNYPTLPPTIQTATATFNCPLVLPPAPDPTCYVGSQAPALLETITVYNEGLNTTNWLVTAPSATGTPNVIHCGPGWALNPPPNNTGGSVCVATYPVGTPVVLTATQPTATTGTFGGWSSSCAPDPNPPTAGGPNTCTVIPTYIDPGNAPTNITVGAIFN
jgi:uncharacterized protein YjdB